MLELPLEVFLVQTLHSHVGGGGGDGGGSNSGFQVTEKIKRFLRGRNFQNLGSTFLDGLIWQCSEESEDSW